MAKGNKTWKALKKRFQLKKSKKGTKIMKVTAGQAHFNSRESGKVTRNKRRDKATSLANHQTILRGLPHNQ